MPRTAEIVTPVPASSTRRALVALLVRTLRPLVLLMLRQGMTAYEFNELARWVFAHIAMDKRHFAVSDRDVWRMTKSRAAVLTGFTRREIDRLVSVPEPAVDTARGTFHRLARVLDAWQTRRGYQDSDGRPRDLPLKGRESFESLARECGRDIPVRALLDEAVERGCVTRPERHTVRFVHANTEGGELEVAELERCGQHAEHFLSMVEATLRGSACRPDFVEVSGGPIAREHRAALQQRVAETVKQFTGEVERQLSAQPKSLVNDNAARFVIGIYGGFV